MANPFRMFRSLTAGNRPSGRAFGEPYWNDADRVFGVINNAGAPIDVASPTWQAGGLVNKFRNTPFDVWQHGVGPTATPNGSFVLTADGWLVQTIGAAGTWQQVAGRLLSRYAMQLIGAAGVTTAQILQRIESYVFAALTSQTATFQAQIYNNTGASVTPKLTVFSYTAPDGGGTVTSVSYTLQPCAAGAWTRVAYTLPISAQAINGTGVMVDFAGALNGAGKSVSIAEADIRSTPGWPIGLCANPPPLELRPIVTEFAFCQRYWQSRTFHCGVYAQPAGLMQHQEILPVVMRTTPGMIYKDLAGNTNVISIYNGAGINNVPLLSGGFTATSDTIDMDASISGTTYPGTTWARATYTLSCEL